MPLGDQARALLTSALRDPLVVTRYRAKMVQVPGSDCLGGVVRCPVVVTGVSTSGRSRQGRTGRRVGTCA